MIFTMDVEGIEQSVSDLSIMPKARSAAKPRAPKGGHQLAKALPAGEILRDFVKQEWKLGVPIGSGGFGLIYLADKNGPNAVSSDAPYVMKLEPHSNGPLFCELHFYQRVAKPDMIEEWTRARKMKTLGVPQYIASGSHDRGGTKYRFMVMQRCGTDLQKIFESNGKSFAEKSVYLLGIKMLDALEYIHEKEYVHADIKASNILTGFGRGKTDEVFLVDYGLAYRYTTDGKHKDYKEDPKRVHDGTIEFTSRDAHKGVTPSRRGDLEILGYCLLQWLCGQLPWENKLADKNYVRDQKIKYMNNIPSLMTKCFPGGQKHDELSKLLRYVTELRYDDQPDYRKCRQWLSQALKRHGGKETDKLVLTARIQTPSKPAKVSRKRKSEEECLPPQKYLSTDFVSDSDEDFEPQSPTPARKTATPRQGGRRATLKAAGGRQGRAGAKVDKSRVTENGEIIPAPAVPPQTAASQPLVNGSGARPKTGSRKKQLMSSTGTQTSPGLKGLRRSRKQ